MLDDSLMISLQIPLCTPIPTFAPPFWHCIINWGPLIIAYDSVTVSPLHPHSDICTPILTFGQTPQKRPILAPKKGKNGPKKKRHFPNPYWRGLFAKNRTQIAQNLPLWRHLHFTPAYMGSPPCTLSQHPNIKETGYSNVLELSLPSAIRGGAKNA